MSSIRVSGWRRVRFALVGAVVVALPFVAVACGDDREDEPPPTLGGATVLEQTTTTAPG